MSGIKFLPSPAVRTLLILLSLQDYDPSVKRQTLHTNLEQVKGLIQSWKFFYWRSLSYPDVICYLPAQRDQVRMVVVFIVIW